MFLIRRIESLTCLSDLKSRGIIRAIGISTHNIEVIERAMGVEEIDVVFVMKVLAGGYLINQSEDVISFVKILKEFNQ